MLMMSMSPRRSPRAPRSARGPARAARCRSLLSVLLLLPALAGCSGDKVESTPATKRPAVPVGVAPSSRKDDPAPDPGHRHRRASGGGVDQGAGRRELPRPHWRRQDVKRATCSSRSTPRLRGRARPGQRPTSPGPGTDPASARRARARSVAESVRPARDLLRDQAQAKNAKVQESATPTSWERGMIAQEQYDGIAPPESSPPRWAPTRRT